MDINDKLILNYDSFSKDIENFFTKLNSSEAIQKMFIKNPVETFTKLVTPELQIGHSEISKSNRLLFAILSNEDFMKWVTDYHNTLRNELNINNAEELRKYVINIDRTKMYPEIIRALMKYMDEEMLYSLVINDSKLEKSLDKTSFSPVAVETLVAAIFVFVFTMVVTQIDFTPVVEKALLNRIDLQRISSTVSSEMIKRANDLRSDGSLSSLDKSIQ